MEPIPDIIKIIALIGCWSTYRFIIDERKELIDFSNIKRNGRLFIPKRILKIRHHSRSTESNPNSDLIKYITFSFMFHPFTLRHHKGKSANLGSNRISDFHIPKYDQSKFISIKLFFKFFLN